MALYQMPPELEAMYNNFKPPETDGPPPGLASAPDSPNTSLANELATTMLGAYDESWSYEKKWDWYTNKAALLNELNKPGVAEAVAHVVKPNPATPFLLNAIEQAKPLIATLPGGTLTGLVAGFLNKRKASKKPATGSTKPRKPLVTQPAPYVVPPVDEVYPFEPNKLNSVQAKGDVLVVMLQTQQGDSMVRVAKHALSVADGVNTRPFSVPSILRKAAQCPSNANIRKDSKYYEIYKPAFAGLQLEAKYSGQGTQRGSGTKFPIVCVPVGEVVYDGV